MGRVRGINGLASFSSSSLASMLAPRIFNFFSCAEDLSSGRAGGRVGGPAGEWSGLVDVKLRSPNSMSGIVAVAREDPVVTSRET